MKILPPNPDLPQGDKDDIWMRQALGLAEAAAAVGEVPVGAIWVNGDHVSVGGNGMVSGNDATGHAEIVALRGAGQLVDNYRLGGTLYVTLEPCPMCAMAIVHARLDRVVYGAADLRQGALGSRFAFHEEASFNHRFPIAPGVLGHECEAQLRAFFNNRREARK